MHLVVDANRQSITGSSDGDLVFLQYYRLIPSLFYYLSPEVIVSFLRNISISTGNLVQVVPKLIIVEIGWNQAPADVEQRRNHQKSHKSLNFSHRLQLAKSFLDLFSYEGLLLAFNY